MKKQICYSFLILIVAVLVGIWVSPLRVVSWLFAKTQGYPTPLHYVEADYIYVPSEDNVMLQTVHFYPQGADLSKADYPTILIRTPYGISASHGLLGMVVAANGYYFASFGYHAIVQNVRGRYNSSGEWNPMINERTDGFATMKWIKAQPWFNGKLGMSGLSYVGYTQFSVYGEDAPIKLSASVPSVTSPALSDFAIIQDAPNLEACLKWLFSCHESAQKDPSFFESVWGFIKFSRDMDKLFYSTITQTVPLKDSDIKRYNERISLVKDIFGIGLQGLDGEYWGPRNHKAKLASVTPGTVHVMGGWYDIFINATIQTYENLTKLGKEPYLTIFGGAHLDPEILFSGSALSWFDHLLKGDSSRLRRKPVAVTINPTNEWLELDSWPPATTALTFYLQEGGKLGTSPLSGTQKEVYKYTFDPFQPTPIYAGYLLLDGGGRDNFPLITERQNVFKDMLVFSTPKFERDTILAGRVLVKLFVSSSLAYTDFYVRLYDFVPEKSTSINVCEGLLRINNNPKLQRTSESGFVEVLVTLEQTVYKFMTGHAVMISVASGAHPRVPRNPGTGESIANATTFLKANQQVIVSAEYPSSVIFPVLNS